MGQAHGARQEPFSYGTIGFAGGRFVGSAVRLAGLHGPCHLNPPRSHGRSRGLSIRFEAFRQPRRLVLAGRIALRARHPGAAAVARVRASERLIGMVFTHPCFVLAENAFHWPNMEFYSGIANIERTALPTVEDLC